MNLDKIVEHPNFRYDCYKEGFDTEWCYVSTHDKIELDHKEHRVYEYRCMSCKKATMYITPDELEKMVEAQEKI